MIVKLEIPTEKMAALELKATAEKREVEDILLDAALGKKAKQPSITLGPDEIERIRTIHDGRLIRNAKDVVAAVEDAHRVTVNGTVVTLTPEDAQALKDQFASTSYKSYDEYLAAVVNEALSLHLWGSYRGILAL